MAPSKAQPAQAKSKTTANGHNGKKAPVPTVVPPATTPTAAAGPVPSQPSSTPAAASTTSTSAPGAAANRPVVFPAIPLPMMQKQSAKRSSHHKASKPSKAPTNNHTDRTTDQTKSVPVAEGSPHGFPDASASLDAALIDKVVSSDGTTKPTKPAKGQHMQSAKPSGGEVNGSNVEKPEQFATHASVSPATATTPTDVATPAADNANTSPDSARSLTNGTNGTDGHSKQTTVAKQLRSSATFNAEIGFDTVDSTAVSAPAVDTKQGTRDAPYQPAQGKPDFHARRVDQPHVLHHQVPPPPYQPHSDGHPDHPGFHPGPRMHHHHMSNGGGIMFGGLPESHTPSPAPHPGAFMPPPPMPVNGENPNFPRVNGHHHAQSNGNGFPGPVPGPINTQFRPDMVPVSSMDTYGPLSAHAPQGPLDGFPPGANRYGPPTPHSFHGSHTSGEPNGMEGGPIPFPPNNAVHYPGLRPHEHPAGRHHHVPHPHHPHGPPFPPFLHSRGFARRQPSIDSEIMESMSYFRNQFDNGELADCVLELVYTNGRHHPVKITGHKLILAQSPVLKRYIMSARNADRTGSHTFTIESSDAYLRSDAWWTAVQRLYLHPLLTLPPMIGNGANGMDFAGDKIDRFEFCLGYAAAGHLLDMQDVLIRGLQIASDLLNWVTVETALGFVLEGAVQRHSDFDVDHDGTNTSFVELEYNYGQETKILMDGIISFLINAFPPNFEFDSTVTDPLKYFRVPAVPGPAAVTSPRTSIPPAIARGSNPHKAGKPAARLGSIKFGDLPPAFPEDGPMPHRDFAKCSPILSRILLNLPFDVLRVVLTSESNGVSGWNTAQDRYHTVADVVAAREARRLKAVDAVRAGAIPNSHDIQKRLSARRRYVIAGPWDILNWQEEVIYPQGAEVPQLLRKWVPQFAAPPETELPKEAPAPAYNIPESMV